MKIEVYKVGAVVIMELRPDRENESDLFEEFCRPNEPLTATLKKCPDYTWPHMEIRKKIL